MTIKDLIYSEDPLTDEQAIQFCEYLIVREQGNYDALFIKKYTEALSIVIRLAKEELPLLSK